MLKDFGGLTQQLFEKPFKNMLYSIYNFAEDEFYIYKLKNLGYDVDIDNLEYITLVADNITSNEKLLFKQYIESELQKDKVVVGVLLYKGKKGLVPIIIKPKNVDIETIFNKN